MYRLLSKAIVTDLTELIDEGLFSHSFIISECYITSRKSDTAVYAC